MTSLGFVVFAAEAPGLASEDGNFCGCCFSEVVVELEDGGWQFWFGGISSSVLSDSEITPLMGVELSLFCILSC